MQRILLITLLLTLSACAGTKPPLTVESVQVQKGVFRQNPCDEEPIPDTRIDMCLCEADLKAAATGDAALDAELRKPAEEQRCKGEPVPAPEDAIIEQSYTQFTVTRDDAHWFSVVYDVYTYPAGAAHGMTVSEVKLYDRQGKRWVRQDELPPPQHRDAAAEAVAKGLEKLNGEQYENMLWPDTFRPAELFSDKGCEGCVVFPSAEGKWTVRFYPYGVGPYAVGQVDVELDASYFR